MVHAATAAMHAASASVANAASTAAASDLRQKIVAHVRDRARAAENLNRFGLRRSKGAYGRHDAGVLDQTHTLHGLSSM
jgi:hypothetical protein